MYQPWVAHHYPGITLQQILLGEWSLSGYVAMADYIKG